MDSWKKLPSLQVGNTALGGLSLKQTDAYDQASAVASALDGESAYQQQITLLEDTLALREQELVSTSSVIDGLRKERNSFLRKFEDAKSKVLGFSIMLVKVMPLTLECDGRV